MDSGLSLRNVFLGLLLHSNVAKMGTIACAYVSGNPSLLTKECAISCRYNLQCQ